MVIAVVCTQRLTDIRCGYGIELGFGSQVFEITTGVSRIATQIRERSVALRGKMARVCEIEAQC
jgi:hypothetical protein